MKSSTTEQIPGLCEAADKKQAQGKALKKHPINLYEIIVRAIGILPSRALIFPGIVPFGLAWLAMERRFSVGAVISAALTAAGYASLLDIQTSVKYICALLLYLIFLFAADRDDCDISCGAAAGAAGIAAVISGIGIMIWTGFTPGGLAWVLCDASLVCFSTIVFEKNRCIFNGRKAFISDMSTEQKVCLGILACIALLGFRNIEIYGFFSAANIVGLWAIAVIAICGGARSAVVCGIITGLIIGMYENMLVSAAVFAICAIAGGLAAHYGKTATAVAVGAAAILTVLLGGDSTLFMFGYTDIPIFIIALIATPDHKIRTVGRVTGLGKSSSCDTRHCEYIQNRLDSAATSFRTLAATFLDLSDDNDSDIENASVLFDGVADRVCRECSKLSECWVNNFSFTYKAMYRMLKSAEKCGELSETDADEAFSGKCLRLRAVVREMNRLFEIYKINCVWKSKLSENRELAGQQLASVAQILDDLSCELCGERPDISAGEEVRIRLASKGVETGCIDVIISSNGRYSAYIEILGDKNIRNCARLTENALHAVLGIKMTAVGAVDTDNGITLKFVPLQGYRIEAGAASIGKNEDCGDNCIMKYLSGGKYAAALSDGMGTGCRAARDSSATVKLLGDFLDAGFDKSIAVRLINSIMVMKSADEAFATVDMCVIDLFGGDAEFVKNGAEPSYIKRNNVVETVRAASLPVGILQEMEIETFAHKLTDGDIIVMTSDGLQMKKGYENWIRTMVEDSDSEMPPQELADRIIDMAKTLHGGTADDDMTVMVMKLVEI